MISVIQLYHRGLLLKHVAVRNFHAQVFHTDLSFHSLDLAQAAALRAWRRIL